MLDQLTVADRPRGAGAIRNRGRGRADQAPESARAEQAERLRPHARRARAHRPPVSRRRRRAGAEHSRRRRPTKGRDPFGGLQGSRESERRRRCRGHAHLQPGLFEESAFLQTAAHARIVQEDFRRQDHGDPQLGFRAAERPDARWRRRSRTGERYAIARILNRRFSRRPRPDRWRRRWIGGVLDRCGC